MSPFQFSWSEGASIGGLAENLPAGAIYVSITDASNCIYTDSINIEQVLLDFEVEPLTPSCNGNPNGSAELIVSSSEPSFYVDWGSGHFKNLLEIPDLLPGMYEVTLSNDAGRCDIVRPLTIEEASLNVEATVENVSCPGEADGSIELSIAEGQPPYQIQWQGGDTTTIINNLEIGFYQVTITDAVNCEVVQQFMVNNPSDIAVQFNILGDSPLTLEGDGEVEAIADGGTPPYTYSWSNGDTTQTALNLSAGEYELSVTDAVGCLQVFTVTVDLINSTVEAISQVALAVFPNPSKEHLTISFSKRLPDNIELTIFSASGLKVSRQFIPAGHQQWRMDVSRLPSGVYYLEMLYQNEVKAIRFVKV